MYSCHGCRDRKDGPVGRKGRGYDSLGFEGNNFISDFALHV